MLDHPQDPSTPPSLKAEIQKWNNEIGPAFAHLIAVAMVSMRGQPLDGKKVGIDKAAYDFLAGDRRLAQTHESCEMPRKDFEWGYHF